MKPIGPLGCLRASAAVMCILWAAAAHAVWNDSIPIVGGTPVPAGATVRLTTENGQVVDGAVKEHGDDQALVFTTSGDGPPAGTIEITSAGKTTRYQLPRHRPEDRISLDLTASAVLVQGAPMGYPVNARDTWEVVIGATGANLQTDYFGKVLDGQAAELDTLFTGFGGTGNDIRSSADDSASGYGINIGVKRHVDPNSALYFTASWMDANALDGKVTGTSNVAGGTLEAVGAGESELRIYAAALGYERAFARASRWRWYAGGGAAWVDLKDQSRSVLLFNGTQVAESSASGHDHDHAAFIEAGIRLHMLLQRLGVEVDLGVRQTNELFAGEGSTVWALGLSTVL